MDDNNFNNQETQQTQEQQSQQVVKQKKPFYKKVWFWILLILIIFVFTYSAISSSDSDNDSESTSTTEVADTEITAETDEEESEYTIGDYEVYVVEAKVTEDYSGDPAISITYSFTNNSDDASSFAYAISDGVYQDGVELEFAFDADYNYAGEDYSTDIQPGNTLEVTLIYNLRDTTTAVDIELTDILGISNDTVTTTIEIAE